MSKHPWAADRLLDAAGAKAQIERMFPELQPRDVTYFAEGWDFRMFEVDGTWLFRFPKREKEVERLAREIALMDLLRGRLPVAVPVYEHRSAGLAGYRKLDGHAMVGREVQSAFAGSLARSASALHAIDPGDLRLPGELDVDADEENSTAALRDEARQGLDAARERMDAELVARCAAHLDTAPSPAYAGTPRLVHNDLYPAHVLLGESGGVRSVLDWGDAYVGVPTTDLVIAYFWGGRECFRAAVGEYAGELDSDSEARARFGAACMAIGHITFGVRADAPAFVRSGLRALDRVDRGAG